MTLGLGVNVCFPALSIDKYRSGSNFWGFEKWFESCMMSPIKGMMTVSFGMINFPASTDVLVKWNPPFHTGLSGFKPCT